MPDLLVILALATALGLFAFFIRGSLIRGQARKRLQAPLTSALAEAEPTIKPPAAQPAESIFRRHRVFPWILAIAVGFSCFYLLGLKLIFCVSIAVIVELLAAQGDHFLLERKKAIVDQQLADALDLMISTLRAGAGLLTAIERATEELKPPLKHELHNVLGLIRYGDEPRSVMRRLMRRIPLESFRLFTMTLSVHFEVGGTLAPTLAVVGRIVRDRIEIARRIRSLTAQARVSTIALIVMTYLIAFVMWRHDPPGVRSFASSPMGSALVAGTMILQAVGIVWQSSMSKVRV